MRKRFTKAAALVTCFALLSLYAPLSYAGHNVSYNKTIGIAGELFSSIFFFLPPAHTIGLRAIVKLAFPDQIAKADGSLDSLRTGGAGDCRTTGSLDSLRTGGGGDCTTTGSLDSLRTGGGGDGN